MLLMRYSQARLVLVGLQQVDCQSKKLRPYRWLRGFFIKVSIVEQGVFRSGADSQDFSKLGHLIDDAVLSFKCLKFTSGEDEVEIELLGNEATPAGLLRHLLLSKLGTEFGDLD